MSHAGSRSHRRRRRSRARQDVLDRTGYWVSDVNDCMYLRQEDSQNPDPGLPSADDFSFDGIMKAVEPEVTKTNDAVIELCEHFQASVRTEIGALTERQRELDERMREADALTVKTLKATKVRAERFEAEGAPLKKGRAVDALATATESSHALLTSLMTTLILIDEMLPPPDRLSPTFSPHRNHYPALNSLLAQKAADLNIGLSSRPSMRGAAVSKKRVSMHTYLPTAADGDNDDEDEDISHRRRRTSSASIIRRTSTYGDGTSTGARFIPPPAPPQLELKTILPGTAAAVLTSPTSPRRRDSSSQKVDASQPSTSATTVAVTAAGNTMSPPATAAATSSDNIDDNVDFAAASARRSSVWTLHNARPRTAVSPIDEDDDSSPSSSTQPLSLGPNFTHDNYFSTAHTRPPNTRNHTWGSPPLSPPPPLSSPLPSLGRHQTAPTPQRRMSWRSSSGSWSAGLGGWWGGGRSSGGVGGEERETARDKLERVLSAGAVQDAKGKGRARGGW